MTISHSDYYQTSILPNAKVFPLLGYSNGNEDYGKAKTPITKWQDVECMTQSEVEFALSKDFWIGASIPEGHIVIDVDDKKQGEHLKKLLDGETINHHCIVTPNGYQFVFHAPDQEVKQISDWFCSIGIIVDTRIAKKGYIVLPTKNTEGRKILSECTKDLDVVPNYLLPIRNSLKTDIEFPIPLLEGQRNQTLYNWAASLRAWDIDNDLLKISIFLIYKHFIPNKHGFGTNELKTIVNQAIGWKPERDTFSIHIEDDVLSGKPEEEWGEIVDLSTEDSRLPFPMDVFPPRIEGLLKKIATSLQVPIDPVCMMMFSVVSVLTAGRVTVSPKDGWTEEIVTYLATLMPSGTNKTGIFKVMNAPIHELEKEQMRENAVVIKKNASRSKVLQTQIANLESKIAKGQESLQSELDRKIELLSKLEQVDNGELLLGDTSPEFIPIAMKNNGEKIAMLTDEGSIIKTLQGRFNENSNIELILSAFNGTLYKSGRVGRGQLILNKPLLTIGAFIQPDKINDFTKESFEQGLPQRFFYSYPNIKLGYRTLESEGMSLADELSYDSIINSIHHFPSCQLAFDEESFEMFNEFYKETQLLMRKGNQFSNSHYASWMSKSAGFIARLIGALHIMSGTRSDVIKADTVKKGVKLFEYFKSHYLYVFGNENNMDADTQFLLDFLIESKKYTFNIREDIQQKQKRLKSISKINSCLNYLESMHYVKTYKEVRKNMIKLNPELTKCRKV